MKKAILVSCVLLFASACTSVDDKDWKPRATDDKEYVTGSNLPRRGSSGARVDTLSKEQAEDLQRARPGPMPMGGGR